MKKNLYEKFSDFLALQYLHEMEIAHRDIKCENVLLTSNYNVKLADFGFARYVIDQRGKHVLSDTYCGSLSYAAPEILRGMPYNPKFSDVWSIGVILYILLNKAMPFDDTNIKRLYEQQANRRWKFRGKIADTLSEFVKKLIRNLLEPDVNKRWKIDQVIHSEWIAMDPRLTILTLAEQTALNNAVEEKRKNEDKFLKKETINTVKSPKGKYTSENSPLTYTTSSLFLKTETKLNQSNPGIIIKELGNNV